MSVLSSPSPTLSPTPAFAHEHHHHHNHHHRSSFASLRRTSSHRSSYRSSPSAATTTSSSGQFLHSHASSPATSIHSAVTSTSTLHHNHHHQYHQQTPTSAPKRRALDDGRGHGHGHGPGHAQGKGPGKPTSTDASTQYSPPDLPPTARQPMNSTGSTPLDEQEHEQQQLSSESPAPLASSSSAPTTDNDDLTEDVYVADLLQRTQSRAPAEPALRQDPQPHTPIAPAATAMTAAAYSAPTTLLSDTTSSSSTSGDVKMSPAKRARGETAVRVMPLDYMKSDVRDLGIVTADMLMELIRINDPLPVRNEQLTRYHSRAPPAISVHDYLTRLIVHATLSPPILLSLVYYIDKLSALYPVFNISSLTVHRYLITATTVAAKGLSDSFWTNNTYARVGGISVRELALLELDFLERMDWRIVPPPDILVDYYRNLVERSDNYVLEQPQTQTQGAGQPEGSAGAGIAG